MTYQARQSTHSRLETAPTIAFTLQSNPTGFHADLARGKLRYLLSTELSPA
jgi:hypothetical protein